MSIFLTNLKKIRAPLTRHELTDFLFDDDGVEENDEVEGYLEPLEDFARFDGQEFIFLSVCSKAVISDKSRLWIGLTTCTSTELRKYGFLRVDFGGGGEDRVDFGAVFEHVQSCLQGNCGQLDDSLFLNVQLKVSTLTSDFETNEFSTVEAACRFIYSSFDQTTLHSSKAIIYNCPVLELNPGRVVVLLFGCPETVLETLLAFEPFSKIPENSIKKESRVVRNCLLGASPCTVQVEVIECQVEGILYEFVPVKTGVVGCDGFHDLIKNWQVVSLCFVSSCTALTEELTKNLEEFLTLLPKCCIEDMVFCFKNPSIASEFNDYYHKAKIKLIIFPSENLLQQLSAHRVDTGALREFAQLRSNLSNFQSLLFQVDINSSFLEESTLKQLYFCFGALIHVLQTRELGFESIQFERVLLDSVGLPVKMHNGDLKDLYRLTRKTAKEAVQQLQKVTKTCYHYSETERKRAEELLQLFKLINCGLFVRL